MLYYTYILGCAAMEFELLECTDEKLVPMTYGCVHATACNNHFFFLHRYSKFTINRLVTLHSALAINLHKSLQCSYVLLTTEVMFRQQRHPIHGMCVHTLICKREQIVIIIMTINPNTYVFTWISSSSL